MPKQPVLDADQLRRYVKRESRIWGARIKARRKSLKLTLDDVATLSFTTSQTIFKIEEGQIVPRDHLRLAIAFALQCEPEELFALPSRAAVMREVA